MDFDSFDLLQGLKNLGYPRELRDPLWWPNSGTFEIVLGAILTQNTKWQNVEKALQNLRASNACSLGAIVEMDAKSLATLVKPSGFYNTKTKYIKLLCKNIDSEFGSFEAFQENVSREWLLEQKGIGEESADDILCYGCHREEMVADAYSHRLLVALGIELENYEEVKSFLARGLRDNEEKVLALYSERENVDLATVFAWFHGQIVEYCASHSAKKVVDASELKEAMEAL